MPSGPRGAPKLLNADVGIPTQRRIVRPSPTTSSLGGSTDGKGTSWHLGEEPGSSVGGGGPVPLLVGMSSEPRHTQLPNSGIGTSTQRRIIRPSPTTSSLGGSCQLGEEASPALVAMPSEPHRLLLPHSGIGTPTQRHFPKSSPITSSQPSLASLGWTDGKSGPAVWQQQRGERSCDRGGPVNVGMSSGPGGAPSAGYLQPINPATFHLLRSSPATSSQRSLVSLGCTDGKHLVIKRVPTSPAELFNFAVVEGQGESLDSGESSWGEEEDPDSGTGRLGALSGGRGSWGNKLQFVLACVGCSVGLGNLWRFPYLAYSAGGGSFLVPYYLMRLVCGIPLLYMELAIGQFTCRGPIGAFSKLSPLFKGVGLSSVVVAFFMSTYYNMIIAYALFYFFSAFRSKLPWVDCSNRWNSQACWIPSNRTKPPPGSESPAEEFYQGKLLKQSSGIDELGSVRWELAACLLFAWIIVYFALWKSVRSSGRVLYVTATLPFLLVLAFLGRSLTLDGAQLGLDYLFTPHWDLLKESKVWMYAAAQNFNSIGIAFGGVITFASYNKEENRILPDTLIISIINDVACMVIAVFSFATIGNIAVEHQVPIEKAISDSPGMVFIVYSSAMAKMPYSSAWAVLFFFMLLCLGLNTQFAIVEVVVTSVQDGFPNWVKKKVVCHELLVLAVCLISFFLGFPLVTQGGIFFFQLMDHYAVCNSIIYIAFFEVVAVAWFYGAGRLSLNIQRMTGEKTNAYFKFCWIVAAPALTFFVWMFSILDYSGLVMEYENYEYPIWAEVLGWCISGTCLLPIPVLMVYVTMVSEGKNIFKKFCNATQPRIEDIPPPIKEVEVKEMKTLLNPAATLRPKSNSLDHITLKLST